MSAQAAYHCHWEEGRLLFRDEAQVAQLVWTCAYTAVIDALTWRQYKALPGELRAEAWLDAVLRVSKGARMQRLVDMARTALAMHRSSRAAYASYLTTNAAEVSNA